MQGATFNYFTLPSLAWMINIIVGLYCFLFGAVFFPHLLPYSYIGPGGTAIKFFNDNIPYGLEFVAIASTLAHLSEAIYSWNLCTSKGIVGSARIKWFVSTVFFGGASLYELAQFRG